MRPSSPASSMPDNVSCICVRKAGLRAESRSLVKTMVEAGRAEAETLLHLPLADLRGRGTDR